MKTVTKLVKPIELVIYLDAVGGYQELFGTNKRFIYRTVSIGLLIILLAQHRLVQDIVSGNVLV